MRSPSTGSSAGSRSSSPSSWSTSSTPGSGWARYGRRRWPTSWPRYSPSWATSSGRSGTARAATGAARPCCSSSSTASGSSSPTGSSGWCIPGSGSPTTSPTTWPTSSASAWPRCSGCTATVAGSSSTPRERRPPRSDWSRRPRGHLRLRGYRLSPTQSVSLLAAADDGQVQGRLERGVLLGLGQVPDGGHPVDDVHQARPGVGRVDQRVVVGRRVYRAGQHGRLHHGQLAGLPPEVAAAGRLESVVAVAVVRDLRVQAQDLGPAVASVELHRQDDLLDDLRKAAVARGVQVLGELLIQGATAAVGVSGHPGGRHPEQRERVHARVGVEPVVFGGHQGLGEVLRNRRAGVGDVVLGRLGFGQGGGLAGRGSERVQQDDASQEHGDYDGNYLDDPESQAELPAAPAPLVLPVPPGERARWLVVD